MDEIYEAIEEGPIGVKILEKGKAEGKAQGIFQGERTAIDIFWQRGFGKMAPDIVTALDAATESQLRALLELLAGAPTEAEARSLLGI